MEDDLVNYFFGNDLPLDGLGSLANLLDHWSVAGAGKRGQYCIDAEIVKGGEYRIAISLGGLLIVFSGAIKNI